MVEDFYFVTTFHCDAQSLSDLQFKINCKEFICTSYTKFANKSDALRFLRYHDVGYHVCDGTFGIFYCYDFCTFDELSLEDGIIEFCELPSDETEACDDAFCQPC